MIGASILLLLPAAAPAGAQEGPWTVRAERIHTAAGETVEGGHVRVEDGRIASVGEGRGRGEAVEVFAVTPGLVDLSIRIDTGVLSVEQSTETPITLEVRDALDLFDTRWDAALHGGVTTALASPADRAVIGGYGTVLKTGGEPTVEARVVKDRACLRGSMGSEPSRGNRPPRGGPPASFYYRRPTTRMGVEWVFRKSFHDAIAARRRGEVSPEDRVLLAALDGELPFFVQAWPTQDVRTAVFLKEELGIPSVVLDAAAEAWKEPDLVARSGAAVVLPPFRWQGETGTESSFMAWNTAAVLHEKGVPVALSSHGSPDPADALARQPGYAMRGGLPFEAALEAVTIAPARMVGVDDRVGSIEPGKDADLVLWDGPPFEITSRIVGVVLDGRLVVDSRTPE